MHRPPLVTGRFLTTALALAAGAVATACFTSTESQPAEPTDALGATSVALKACTQIGCNDGLQVALEAGREWPQGSYRFEIRADDVDVTCRASLPLAPCTTDPRGTAPISNVLCEPFGVVQIVESGCALPSPTHGFPAIVFDPKLRPQTVEIAVPWNRTPVRRADFAARFEKVQPNGPSCPPTCHGARATLTLDF